jgi:hypothetical protein
MGLSVINKEFILRGIAVTFKGKRDKKEVTLMLWADDDHPELCPLRHLLAFFHILGHDSSFLFPDFFS